jgi:hypothetical protein
LKLKPKFEPFSKIENWEFGSKIQNENQELFNQKT